MTISVGTASLGDYGLFRENMDNIQSIQKEVQKKSQQSSTGLKGNLYLNNAENAYPSIRNKVEMQDLVQIGTNIQVVKERVSKAEISVNNAIDIMKEFNTRLNGTMNSGQNDPGFRQFCEDALVTLESVLNIRDNYGNAIFGGYEFEKDPFDVSLVPVPDLTSDVSKDSYNGTSDAIISRVGLNSTIQINFCGDKDAFFQMMYCLKTGASYEPDYTPGSTNTLMLQKAMDMSGPCLKGLSRELQDIKTLGAKLVTNEDAVEDQKILVTEMRKELDSVDEIEAWIEKIQAESQLLMASTALKNSSEITRQIINTII